MQHTLIICMLSLVLAPWCSAMDKDASNTDLIQKLPTILKDHGLKYPNDPWIRQLTQLLTIPQKKCNTQEIRTAINKTTGRMGDNIMNINLPRLSPYTIERLATEMKELVLDKKPAPNLPYNQDIEEQNNFFFARLLPEPFATEIARWTGDYSILHRQMAYCMYALCNRTTPEDTIYTTDDPVLEASGSHGLTLKERTQEILNQYKYVGCKLWRTPTDRHCQAIIGLLYGNDTVIDATRTINKCFNRYWCQTHDEPELAFARSTLIAIHKQLHETILNPNLTLNKNFALTESAVKNTFIECLKKLPLILRKNGTIITLHPPKFDELPPIKSYDKESLAVLPPSWKGKTIQEMAALLPANIVHYLLDISYDGAARSFIFKQDTDFTKKDVIESLKWSIVSLHISPQTYFCLQQAFLHIVHGTEVNMHDPRLSTIDALQELQKKLSIVQQLPLILQDLLWKHSSDEKYNLHRILNPFYRYAQGVTWHKKNGLLPIYMLVEKHNNTQNAWYFRAISPQTTAHIMKDYTNGKRGKPYDIQKELNNFTELIQQFPDELRINPTDALDGDKPELWQLTFIAYWLQRPTLQNVMGGRNHTFKKLIKNVYERSCHEHGIPPRSNLDPIIETFAKTFGPLTYCHDALVKRICTTDKDLRTRLEDTLEGNCGLIRARNTNKQLQALDLKDITAELKNYLPACPLCLDLFSDQFTAEKCSRVGAATHLVSCNHVVCSTCLSDRTTTECPLCSINSENPTPQQPQKTSESQ